MQVHCDLSSSSSSRELRVTSSSSSSGTVLLQEKALACNSRSLLLGLACCWILEIDRLEVGVAWPGLAWAFTGGLQERGAGRGSVERLRGASRFIKGRPREAAVREMNGKLKRFAETKYLNNNQYNKTRKSI